WTIASSLLSAMTFMMVIVNFSRASRYAPHAAISVFASGLVHCAALAGGRLLARSGDWAMSWRVLNGEFGLRARYSRSDSSAISGFAARFARSAFRLGMI